MEGRHEFECEHAFYDFGTVSTGTQAFKIISVKNDRTIPQHFEITRDPDTNPLDQSFNIEPYTSPEIQPYGVFTFKIEYSPVVPFTISYDYFNIFDGFGLCCQFGVKGKSLGPLVEASNHNVMLSLIGMSNSIQETINLNNDSADYARFQFDYQNDIYFQIEPLHGIIAPKSQVPITVTFSTDEPGVYIRNLYCLVLFQSPLMIEVLGLKTFNEKLRIENVAFSRYLVGDTLVGGFEGFMSDTKKITESPPPISLSNNFIDFGLTEVNVVHKKPQIVCMTNHIVKEVTVQWISDGMGIFSIEPATVKIDSNETAIFEVFFSPEQPDTFYDRHYVASIAWGEKSTYDSLSMHNRVLDIPVPVTLTLRLVGNSFTERSGCVPSYQILPAIIRMPPCVPPISVYNTFCIERLGKEPMMFKFIPPKSTNYIVKPMNGVIHDDFQIIVVGVCPESKEEAPYFERWTLQFNSSPLHEITLDFCAYAEYPKIEVGEENIVMFPPTFPGTEQNGEVCLKNFTRHYIWYHFSVNETESSLRLLEGEGAIASNEILYNTWQFAPKHEGVHMITINCDTCALLDCWCPLGTFVSTEISVIAECEITNLVSFPSEWDHGIVCHGTLSKCSFHLFNFGRCKMYFTLKCVPADDTSLFAEKDVDIFPATGKIEGFGNKEIFVTLRPSKLGEHVFSIAYEIRPNSKSSLNVLPEPEIINTVYYDSVLPKMKIIDLNYIGGGRIMSKVWLWQMFQINRLNELQNTILPGSKVSVVLDMPQALMDSPPLTVFLLFKNISEVTAQWRFKYQESCACVVRTDHLTRREFKRECNHRAQISVYPLSGEIQGNEESVLMITVKYNVMGKHEARFHFSLDSDRTIILIFQTFSFPPEYCAPSVYIPELHLQGSFIGDARPCIEGFWLYNNVTKPTFYNVDVSDLKNYNIQNMYDVITCINPSGTIQPKSAYPILFRFSPKALDVYEVIVHVWLGSERNYELKITGHGLVSHQKLTQQLTYRVPKVTLFDLKEISVFLSTIHIPVGPFLTFSQEERIFFIDNRSPNNLLGYLWHEYELPGIMSCTVDPVRGILQPGESHVCRIIIKSSSQPCVLTVNVVCEITNLTLLEMHNRAVMLREEMILKHKDIFTITELGITNPDCNLEPVAAPQPVFRALSVTCNIISAHTVDDKLSVNEQLKLYPIVNCPKPVKKCPPRAVDDEHLVNTIKCVLQNLIWDIMFSKRFEQALEKIKNEDNPLYGQFIMDPKEESKLVQLHKFAPSRNIIAAVIRHIIFELFHEEYNLGLYPNRSYEETKARIPHLFLNHQ